MTNGSLMKVESIAECSPWSEAQQSCVYQKRLLRMPVVRQLVRSEFSHRYPRFIPSGFRRYPRRKQVF